MLIRQGSTSRVPFVLLDAVGTPATGITAAAFLNTAVTVVRGDSTTLTVALTTAVNLIEVDSTAAPGLYHVILPDTASTVVGEMQVAASPAADLFVAQINTHQIYAFFSAVETDAVELLAQDSLLLTFAGEVRNDAELQDLTNYTIVADDAGIPVTVRDVIIGPDVTVNRVVLVFTKPTLGEQYTVTASGMLDADGAPVLATTKQFICRLTKMDHVLKGLPQLYTREHRSTLRNVLQALSRVDELIGGNRNDTLGMD